MERYKKEIEEYNIREERRRAEERMMSGHQVSANYGGYPGYVPSMLPPDVSMMPPGANPYNGFTPGMETLPPRPGSAGPNGTPGLAMPPPMYPQDPMWGHYYATGPPPHMGPEGGGNLSNGNTPALTSNGMGGGAGSPYAPQIGYPSGGGGGPPPMYAPPPPNYGYAPYGGPPPGSLYPPPPPGTSYGYGPPPPHMYGMPPPGMDPNDPNGQAMMYGAPLPPPGPGDMP